MESPLLAIDVGNSHTVYGVYANGAWRATWRRGTEVEDTEDEIAAWLAALYPLAGLTFGEGRVAAASVVPGLDGVLRLLASKYFGTEATFLTAASPHGLRITYDPAHAVGADRIANAIAALEMVAPPIVVIDFGTATTFDVIDASKTYLGGAILPGPVTALQTLTSRTAKLPGVELQAPPSAIGRNTVHALQSGAVFGYAGAIEALTSRITSELGATPTILATGGLAAIFQPLCPSITVVEPMLTLEGLRLYESRI